MKEFNDLLKEIGIKRKDFALMLGLTYNSIGSMLSKDRPTPKWVTSALIVSKSLKYELDKNQFKIELIKSVLENTPELNISDYDHSDVVEQDHALNLISNIIGE